MHHARPVRRSLPLLGASGLVLLSAHPAWAQRPTTGDVQRPLGVTASPDEAKLRLRVGEIRRFRHEIDQARAFAWLSLAAEHGLPKALHKLSIMEDHLEARTLQEARRELTAIRAQLTLASAEEQELANRRFG